MTSISPGDARYAAAMREAKAQFEAAMAKGAIKGRGRPASAAAKPASAPAAVVDVDVADDEILEEIAAVTAEAAPPDRGRGPAEPEPVPPTLPAPPTTPVAKLAKAVQGAATATPKGKAKSAARPAAKAGGRKR